MFQEGFHGNKARTESIDGHGRIRKVAGDCKIIVGGSIVTSECLDGVFLFTKSVALKGLSWNGAFRGFRVGGDFHLFYWWKDKVIINILETRDMDVILIVNELFIFVPKGCSGLQLSFFSKNLETDSP